MTNFEEIINDSKPTLVDFYATWCGPCKMMHPILEQLKERLGDTANIIKIDVDKNQELAVQYRIQSVPTLLIFRNGEMKWRGTGVHQLADLEKLVSGHIEKEIASN
ncbi:MAG: thioredoxin [Muribaculum sp.]|nr:thioredoxin [Muribaculum sp.]